MTSSKSAVFQAAAARPIDLEALARAIASGSPVDSQSWSPSVLYTDELTPLHVIALSQDRENAVEAAEQLCAAGAQVDARSQSYGWTPLNLAAQSGHTELVQWLLAHGADPNAESTPRDSSVPLVAVLKWSHQHKLPVVKALLAAGAAPDGCGSGTIHPLTRAVKRNAVAIIECLLAAGAQPDVLSGDAQHGTRTPLMRAVAQTHPEAAAALLAGGADVQVSASDGHTALHAAVQAHQSGHAATLLEHGAAVDAQDGNGHSPLMALLSRQFRPTPLALVALLLAQAPDLELIDQEGRSALHLALDKGEAEVVKRLIAAGANRSQPDASGVTPLSRAQQLPKRLQLALGVREDTEPVPPTQAFLDGLDSGGSWTWRKRTLHRRGQGYAPAEYEYRATRWTRAYLREHVAWLLLFDEAGAQALQAWLAERSLELGETPRSIEALQADLQSREANLVARVRLKLTSAHGAAIIEAAVRAGYQPTESNKERQSRWSFLPEARQGGRFRNHKADPGNPRGTTSFTNAAGFRRRFSRLRKTSCKKCGATLPRSLPGLPTSRSFACERSLNRTPRIRAT